MKKLRNYQKKGELLRLQKEQRVTTEGRIGTYIHTNGKLGVMVELNCETDFVAKNEVFQQFLKDVCMQVAATKPIAIRKRGYSKPYCRRTKKIFLEEAKGKPANIVEKITAGKMDNFTKRSASGTTPS